MRKFKFYKEPDGKWFVDLPEWTGEKAALQMVIGADTMLDYMAEGENEVNAYISEEHFFAGADVLEFIRETTEVGEGATYILKKYRGVELNLEMWLCGVTHFLFKSYPKNIYIILA